MFEALQNGSVVLINTSKALLKTDASALFGRYMIARVISAAFERIAVPAGKRTPAFLIVDEAAEYFDDNLETLLSQARKFNVGVLFAHQHLDQLTPSLRAAVAANTSIKLAGGVSDKDARALAADMRTTADFITGMTKRARSSEFACFVRNYTGSAVRLDIQFGALEAAPKMPAEKHRQLIAKNRERYAALGDQPSPTPDTGVSLVLPPDPDLEQNSGLAKQPRKSPDRPRQRINRAVTELVTRSVRRVPKNVSSCSNTCAIKPGTQWSIYRALACLALALVVQVNTSALRLSVPDPDVGRSFHRKAL